MGGQKVVVLNFRFLAEYCVPMNSTIFLQQFISYFFQHLLLKKDVEKSKFCVSQKLGVNIYTDGKG